MHRLPPAAVLFVGLAACSSAPKPDPEAFRAATLAQSGLILAKAREQRDKEGCAAAAPSLRVVAAMGDGQEAAQHELGECLIAMTGASETETALFHEEGLFWLTRAAYAGNARAQRALAVQYGAISGSADRQAEALKWALVYNANPDAKVYGYKALPETFAPGLMKNLPADKVAEAEAFAAAFAPIHLAAFEAPAAAAARGEFRGAPQGGTMRRRR
ncbi:MAG: hypothetical protein VX640_02685 [Pseudomonadota bacterium]|nr:hypothetical protein [Pseudomonadota bacterium]